MYRKRIHMPQNRKSLKIRRSRGSGCFVKTCAPAKENCYFIYLPCKHNVCCIVVFSLTFVCLLRVRTRILSKGDFCFATHDPNTRQDRAKEVSCARPLVFGASRGRPRGRPRLSCAGPLVFGASRSRVEAGPEAGLDSAAPAR